MTAVHSAPCPGPGFTAGPAGGCRWPAGDRATGAPGPRPLPRDGSGR
jgi:hypothetical protein